MRFRITLMAISVLLPAIVRTPAQAAPPSEYQLKAAYLFNFAKFVEWPTGAFAQATSPMVIGVLGDNPFGGDLERTIHGKSINDHPMQVRAVQSLGDAKQCHILFISPSEKKRLPEIVAALRGVPVLTVGESEGFPEAGGMINFVLEGNKIRFQINNDAARNAGLKISSKLLSLAQSPAH